MLYARASGATMWDVDGNAYTDYNNAFGPHLLGYNHPDVLAAVQAELCASPAARLCLKKLVIAYVQSPPEVLWKYNKSTISENYQQLAKSTIEN